MSLFVYANNVSTTLAEDISASDTTITLSSSANLPTLASGEVFPITLTNSTRTVYEICYATAIYGASLTVVRGREGTTAGAWSTGTFAFSAQTAAGQNLGSSATVTVFTLSDLNAFAPAYDGQVIYFHDAAKGSEAGGRHGQFTYISGDQSANITADPQGAIWQPVNGDATGASGAVKRITDGNIVYSEWWRITFDGVTDDTTAWRACATYVTDNQVELLCPGGKKSIITGPVIWGYSSSNYFRELTIRSAGAFASTGCIVDHSAIVDAPGFIIQGARSVNFDGFGLSGPNTAPASFSATNIDPDITNWITSGLSTGRYNPQCGIAIDPYSQSSVPTADQYTYQPFGYDLASSSDIKLKGISLANQFIAIAMLGKNGCDQVTFENPNISSCTYAFVNGNSQARAWEIVNPSCGGIHTMVDCISFGSQIGAAPALIDGEMGNACVRLFNLEGTSAFSPIGFYGESILGLGSLHSGNTQNNVPVNFVNCSINLSENTPSSLVALVFGAPVKFSGGKIDVRNQNVFNCISIGSSLIELDACKLFGENQSFPPVFGVNADGATLFPTVKNSPFVNSVGMTKTTGTIVQGYNLTATRLSLYPWTRTIDDSYTGMWKYTPGNLAGSFHGSGTISSVAFDISAGTMTFNTTKPEEIFINDVLMWKTTTFNKYYTQYVPALKVASISGSTVTCDLLFEPSQYDTTDVPSSMRIVANEWCPGSATLTGDFTSGSTTIANITDTTLLAVGDILLAASGLQNHTRVVSINASAKSIVVNKAPTATATAQALYYGKITAA